MSKQITETETVTVGIKVLTTIQLGGVIYIRGVISKLWLFIYRELIKRNNRMCLIADKDILSKKGFFKFSFLLIIQFNRINRAHAFESKQMRFLIKGNY